MLQEIIDTIFIVTELPLKKFWKFDKVSQFYTNMFFKTNSASDVYSICLLI